jgi:hypothetical protein
MVRGIRLRPTAWLRLAVMATIVAFMASVNTGVSARQATPVASPASDTSAGPLPPAWLEFGPGGVLMARAIVSGSCPPLVLDGLELAMTPRTAASDTFPVVACEATIPFGASAASIGEQQLPLPAGPVTRIAVIGDAGCRLNEWEKKYQACNDPAAWPFAQVARSVAAWQPDLVIHVGDYLYRESPCPADMTGCAGSPFGDNWETWNADFFTPVAPLLGVAPWVMMRGNHETCSRNAEGWFHYLDPRPYQAECQRFTEPYVSQLFGITVAVIDSAEASDTTTTPEEDAEYARQFDVLADLAPDGSWLVTHRPVWGILTGRDGEVQVENAVYEAATGGSLKADYGLVLSGHIHAAESIAFEGTADRPPQVISGNAGTALDDVVTASPTAQELGDAEIEQAETLSSFGFLTMQRDADVWRVTQRNAAGESVLDCLLGFSELLCGGAAST